MTLKVKYHCPFSDSCIYAHNLPERRRYQIIEERPTDTPIHKDKWIKRYEYKCKALKDLDIECSWIKHLSMSNLSMGMAFTALKNTDCIAYALKMTKDKG